MKNIFLVAALCSLWAVKSHAQNENVKFCVQSIAIADSLPNTMVVELYIDEKNKGIVNYPTVTVMVGNDTIAYNNVYEIYGQAPGSTMMYYLNTQQKQVPAKGTYVVWLHDELWKKSYMSTKVCKHKK